MIQQRDHTFRTGSSWGRRFWKDQDQENNNPRLDWVGNDLKAHVIPTPLENKEFIILLPLQVGFPPLWSHIPVFFGMSSLLSPSPSPSHAAAVIPGKLGRVWRSRSSLWRIPPCFSFQLLPPCPGNTRRFPSLGCVSNPAFPFAFQSHLLPGIWHISGKSGSGQLGWDSVKKSGRKMGKQGAIQLGVLQTLGLCQG